MENIYQKGRPSIEQLSKRIHDLEDAQARLKDQLFKFTISNDRKTSNSISTRQHPPHNLTEADYFNILESIDQQIHLTNSNPCIIYRNQAWEKIYGYTADEIRGKGLFDLVLDQKDLPKANGILKHILEGECWAGEFPVRNKRGERFVVIGSTQPFRDENGTIIGVISVTTVVRQYQQIRVCEPTRVPTDHNNQALRPWSLFNYGEIKWEDLIIIELIERGSCGTLYHAVWQGLDVALKLFSKQELSHDLIVSFMHEESLMRRLRHPNILLFMGVVTSPQYICIVTEFLCRGTLFKLLHRNDARLDWRRRIQMAIDITGGINYLHRCLPPIIHRDLNSSILLVDKDWTVKVGDFGLCRTKHEFHVTRNKRIVRPQWMAPEVLRNEQSADERSDVYSYGVVLWEITTKKIPWEGFNSMQVMEAVGLMNQGLDIPKDVDLQWGSLIQRCLCSEAESRPTFQEILEELHDMHMRFKFMLPLHEDKRPVRN